MLEWEQTIPYAGAADALDPFEAVLSAMRDKPPHGTVAESSVGAGRDRTPVSQQHCPPSNLCRRQHPPLSITAQ